LCREGKAAGARLFAEKPGAFVRRLGKYWSAWQDYGSDAETDEPVEPRAKALMPTPTPSGSEDASMPVPAAVAAMDVVN
jgi:hypothetical protein